MTSERPTQTAEGDWTPRRYAPTFPPSRPPLAGYNTDAAPAASHGPSDVPAPMRPVASPPSDIGAASGRRRGWRLFVGAVVALGLVGGGITVGAALADSEAVMPAPTSAVPGEPDIAVFEPESAAVAATEPIVEVARAVSPSVVLVTTGGGQGSGIVYDASGLIVTNAHVVGSASDVGITLHDGTRLDGVVVGADEVHDVAVVSVDATGVLVAADLAESASVDVGQTAVAIGSPFGLTQTVTAGIVSAVGRLFPAESSPAVTRVVEMIQTDAPINPGNSGGALANLEGEVIGMNTSIRTDGTSGGNVGVGFAVPSDSVAIIADRIVAGDSLEFGVLGVSLDDGPDGGALVTSVTPGSGAEIAGIESGDMIVAIDGRPVAGRVEVVAEVQLRGPDTSVELDIDRSGETLTITAVLTAG